MLPLNNAGAFANINNKEEENEEILEKMCIRDSDLALSVTSSRQREMCSQADFRATRLLGTAELLEVIRLNAPLTAFCLLYTSLRFAWKAPDHGRSNLIAIRTDESAVSEKCKPHMV